mgnify:CR=1 FL=1
MNVKRQVKEYLLQLDIFSDDTETNELEKRIGRIATRIFFVLFNLLFLLYILFNSISTKIISQTIYHPSQDEYERLLVRYSETLTCPCRNTAISHESFIHVTPTMHPMCLSGFITDAWISYTINTIDRLSVISVSFLFDSYRNCRLHLYI